MNGENKDERLLLEQAQTRLASLFAGIDHGVELYLFTRPGVNDIYAEAARQVIRAVRQLSPKISLREYGLHHELAQKWKVNRAPTLLFNPDEYAIRWLSSTGRYGTKHNREKTGSNG
jgi:thioredoxin reductase (NADPH)